MLVAKFNCSKCNAVLKPTTPLPGGKQLKCPKCSSLITVPKPEFEVVEQEVEEIEEVEAVEEVEEVEERDRGHVTDRPSSRRRADREDEYEDEEDERRPKRPKRAKKAQGGTSAGKVALVIGAIVLVIAGMGGGGYFIYSMIQGSRPEDARVQAIMDATNILADVNDQSSAQAAKPRLVAVGRRLRDINEKVMADLARNPIHFNTLIDERNRNPEKTNAKLKQFEKDMNQLQKAMFSLGVELQRVNKVPGGNDLLETFFASWGPQADSLKRFEHGF